MEILKMVWEEISVQTCVNCWIKSTLLDCAPIEEEVDGTACVVAEFRELSKEVAADEDIATSTNEIDEQLADMARAVDSGDDDMEKLVDDWAKVEELEEVQAYVTQEAQALLTPEVLLRLEPDPILDGELEEYEDDEEDENPETTTIEPDEEMITELTDELEMLSLQLESFGGDYSKSAHTLNDSIYRTKKIFKDKQWEKKLKAKKKASKQVTVTTFFKPV
jgi:hypothetical protein